MNEGIESTRERASVPKWVQRLTVVTSVLAIVVITCYGAFMLVAIQSMRGPYDDRRKLDFTGEAWMAAEHDSEGARYLMVDDLLAKQPLVGRSRTEIEALLGPLRPPTEYPGGSWCYYLGPEPSFVSVDNIWLGLEFDDGDRVLTTRNLTD